MATNEITVSRISNLDGNIGINMMLNLIDGVSNGWAVVISTNYKLNIDQVSMAPVYRCFVFPNGSCIAR